MSDQKKWFKVWASILNDVAFQNCRWEDIGRWTLLGALICQQGENGKLRVAPPATLLLTLFRVPTIPSLKEAFLSLPNVKIFELDDPVFLNRHSHKWTTRQGDTNDPNRGDTNGCLGGDTKGHGGFIVVMRNWYKYQVDTTHAMRKQRARDKKRGEERRSSTPTSTVNSSRSASAPLRPQAGCADAPLGTSGTGPERVRRNGPTKAQILEILNMPAVQKIGKEENDAKT